MIHISVIPVDGKDAELYISSENDEVNFNVIDRSEGKQYDFSITRFDWIKLKAFMDMQLDIIDDK